MAQRSIPSDESLTVEFKSDLKCLPDSDLVAAVVCLANTNGGEIYLGVEDDGRITGLHEKHQSVATLASFIGNRTRPSVSVRVQKIEEKGTFVAVIEVPKSRQTVATSDGLVQRRRLMADGRPECVPFLPYEVSRRQADLGNLDISASIPGEATLQDLDPLERVRLRGLIQTYGGDASLLTLSDEELDGALGLVRRDDGVLRPTVAGLLFLGRESALRHHIPAYEVAFQVLDGTDVHVNDFYRWPLLRTFERVLEQFTIRVVEEEIQIGLFRVPIPSYDRRAFREAFVNALIHRDFTRLGAVHVRWEHNGVVVSNPGGFVEGVTLANLLVTEPRPRNPLLADVAKRVGLAERTGRGVDLIYQGLLRYGRPAPDFSRSDSSSVVLKLPGGDGDRGLLQLVLEEEKQTGGSLPIDALIALSQLWHERRLDTVALAAAIQRDESAARNVLERLVEADLVEAHGVKKGRTYTLSARVYRQFSEPGAYVRQAGFDTIQQEQMVRQYVRSHGSIKRGQVMDLCKLSPDQAKGLLAKLTKKGVLVKTGKLKSTVYEPGPYL